MTQTKRFEYTWNLPEGTKRHLAAAYGESWENALKNIYIDHPKRKNIKQILNSIVLSEKELVNSITEITHEKSKYHVVEECNEVIPGIIQSQVEKIYKWGNEVCTEHDITPFALIVRNKLVKSKYKRKQCPVCWGALKIT